MAGDNFDEFYKDLKETEKADSKLTPKQQIERLLRPGCTYRNLNPYDVLQIDPELDLEEVKRKYRRLSILVHPDKNPDDKDRAQNAFDAVRKAYSLLEDEKTRKKCFEIVEEARGRTGMNMEEKRRKKRKDAVSKGLPPTGENIRIEEDDPEKYKHAVAILTMKLFADLERRRRELENKISTDAAKTREAQVEAEEKRSIEKEFSKNWEDSRQGRVNSWLSFSGKPVHSSSKTSSSPLNSSATPNISPGNVTPTLPNQGSFHSTGGYSGHGGVRNVSNQQPNAQANYGAGNDYYDQRHQREQAANMAWNHQSNNTTMSSAPEKKQKKKKEKRFSPMGFRPPKHKPESRD